jgi:hypothetical protein
MIFILNISYISTLHKYLILSKSPPEKRNWNSLQHFSERRQYNWPPEKIISHK